MCNLLNGDTVEFVSHPCCASQGTVVPLRESDPTNMIRVYWHRSGETTCEFRITLRKVGTCRR